MKKDQPVSPSLKLARAPTRRSAEVRAYALALDPNQVAKSSRPDRADKRLLATHVDTAIVREFKVLAAEHLQTADAMLHEAYALLLKSYGRRIPNELLRKLAKDGLLNHFRQVAPRI
jgi:hypothetical protein